MPHKLDTFENRLLELLNKVPALKDRANRDTLLRNLPASISLNIARYDKPFADLASIVAGAKECGAIPKTGRHALDIILSNTIFFVIGLALEPELQALRNEFQQLAQKEHTIQIVVVSMTQEQAIDLNDETAFDNQGELEIFRELKAAMQTDGIEDFTSCYGENRDEWKPLTTDELSINKILGEIVDTLNRYREETGRSTFTLDYLSEWFFSMENEERSFALDTLERYGGVIIIDAISMYHPRVRKALINSQLTGKNRIAMVVISPLEPKLFKTNQLLEEQIYSSSMETAYRYFTKNFDPLYEFGVGDVCNLRRWLVSTLPNLDLEKRRLSQEIRSAIRAEVKPNQSPRGIANRIVGSSR